MNIIIFGASGKTGQQVVKQALIQGHYVTAFVRKKSKFHLHDDNLAIVKGDLSSLEQVRAAVRGNEAVISTLGVSRTLRHDPQVIEGIATIVDAMHHENVHRLIYLSVFLASSKKGVYSFFVENILKRIIRAEIKDHEVKERIIREHANPFTIVRATALNDKHPTGRYKHGESIPIKSLLPTISRADVAEFILTQLRDLSYVNKVVLITGDL